MLFLFLLLLDFCVGLSCVCYLQMSPNVRMCMREHGWFTNMHTHTPYTGYTYWNAIRTDIHLYKNYEFVKTWDYMYTHALWDLKGTIVVYCPNTRQISSHSCTCTLSKYAYTPSYTLYQDLEVWVASFYANKKRIPMDSDVDEIANQVSCLTYTNTIMWLIIANHYRWAILHTPTQFCS